MGLSFVFMNYDLVAKTVNVREIFFWLEDSLDLTGQENSTSRLALVVQQHDKVQEHWISRFKWGYGGRIFKKQCCCIKNNKQGLPLFDRLYQSSK